MLYFIPLLILTSAAAQMPAPTAIFLLAGQSNMAGRGGVNNSSLTHLPTWDGVVPPESAPNHSILRLAADLRWVEALEPLHGDIDVLKTNGIGPGFPFAHAVLKGNPGGGGSVIGLVPCAIGGTSIKEWEQGSSVYGQLLNRAKASVQRGGRIKGLLWYQGESDTLNAEDSELYGGRLEKFFTHLRSDLNIPLLPIIQVGIASGEGPYKEGVRRGQFGIEIANVVTVDALGFQFETDGLHLNTRSQVQLGSLLADAYRRFTSHPMAASRLTNAASTTPSHLWSFVSMFVIITFLLLFPPNFMHLSI